MNYSVHNFLSFIYKSAEQSLCVDSILLTRVSSLTN